MTSAPRSATPDSGGDGHRPILPTGIDASRQWVIALERGKASAELVKALRAVAALGMVADLVDAPNQDTGIDLDQLLGDESRHELEPSSASPDSA